MWVTGRTPALHAEGPRFTPWNQVAGEVKSFNLRAWNATACHSKVDNINLDVLIA